MAKSKLEKALGLASSSYIGVSVAANFPDNDNRSSLKIYIGGKWGVCDLCACLCVYISICEWESARTFGPGHVPASFRRPVIVGEQLGKPPPRDKVCLQDDNASNFQYAVHYLYLSDHRHARKSCTKGCRSVYIVAYSYLVRPISADKTCSPSPSCSSENENQTTTALYLCHGDAPISDIII